MQNGLSSALLSIKGLRYETPQWGTMHAHLNKNYKKSNMHGSFPIIYTVVKLDKTFDEVWKDITTKTSNRSSVATLVKKTRNDLIDIKEDHIKVRSEKTRKIRKIPRTQFEQVWKLMVDKGSYISKSHKPYVHSQIICAILSLLDYIQVSYDPLIIHLKLRARYVLRIISTFHSMEVLVKPTQSTRVFALKEYKKFFTDLTHERPSEILLKSW